MINQSNLQPMGKEEEVWLAYELGSDRKLTREEFLLKKLSGEINWNRITRLAEKGRRIQFIVDRFSVNQLGF